MKKIILFLIIITISLGIWYFYQNNAKANTVIFNDENDSLPMALMVETDINTNVYKSWDGNDWPGIGYSFNQEKSSCENGGTLEWTGSSVILKSNTSDKCYAYFDKVTFADCLIQNAAKEKLIQHMEGVGAEDGNYRFTGGDYHLTQKALDEKYNSIYDIISVKLDDGTVQKNNYWLGNNFKFYLTYQDAQTSTSLKSLLTQAIEDGYIERDEINNYVCFGFSESICPKENLYRIIGIYNINSVWQVKLIKADNANKEQLGQNGSFGVSGRHSLAYIGDDNYNKDGYYWNKEGTNKWSDSSLNIVNLNANFVDYLTGLENGDWIKKIADTDWQVGGMTYQNGHNKGVKTAYDYELGTKKNPLTETKKIGLMYVSDYYYAASEKHWNLIGFGNPQTGSITQNSDYRGAIWDNWLWNGDAEWLITPRTEYSTDGAFVIPPQGIASTLDVTINNYGIRPCFYLNSNVEYLSGDGTEANPYRIK